MTRDGLLNSDRSARRLFENKTSAVFAELNSGNPSKRFVERLLRLLY